MLKKQGIPPKDRPPKPKPNSEYPTKQLLALDMIQAFQRHFPDINVTGILADALYGDANFMDRASSVFSGIQVVSQLRWN
ncbi:hypothetical protein [Endozoicomonas acroporae]|uniref:hypothetical protein n=1 Tax=Endozoicomonas acroporae TaxID=1701104 RepID=UPI0013D5CC2F|nr:hypothetical protein [Endozoicomonas acroporae]